jgi:hypothetical protein
VDVHSYEETQETMALLQILAIAEKEIAEGKLYKPEDVIRELRNSSKLKMPRSSKKNGVSSSPADQPPAQ